MSVSQTISLKTIASFVPGFIEAAKNTAWSSDDSTSQPLAETLDLEGPADETHIFQGRIVVAGTRCSFPVQKFVEDRWGDRIILRNEPDEKWPRIRIFISRESPQHAFSYKNLVTLRADGSVDALVLLTRLQMSMAESNGFSIVENRGQEHHFAAKFGHDMRKGLLATCAMVRKLKFIEEFFDRAFSVPEPISNREIAMIELVFKAITEGEFTVRAGEVTIPQLIPGNLDLDHPPFTGPGGFSYRFEGGADEIGQDLFGERLYLGPFTVTLNHAEIANPWALERVHGREHDAADIGFAVYDHQVSFRFDEYVGVQNREINGRKLEHFKRRLANEEPEQLVDLVEESLQAPVSSYEAIQIAMSWLQYNNFPDRYCAQKPVLGPDQENWMVPIFLRYSNGRGGAVGDLVIDVNSGVVERHTPIEEMRAVGSSLAEKLLNAK